MRRSVNIVLAILFAATLAVADDGKICKVLPQYLDKKGQQSLAPSLYERDAYQFYLRKHPAERTTLQMAVEWKGKGLDWSKTMLRAELRGLVTNEIHSVTVELPVKKKGWFNQWAYIKYGGDPYKKFGELIAWRVTFWEGDRQLSEQESALWSGVLVPAPSTNAAVAATPAP